MKPEDKDTSNSPETWRDRARPNPAPQPVDQGGDGGIFDKISEVLGGGGAKEEGPAPPPHDCPRGRTPAPGGEAEPTSEEEGLAPTPHDCPWEDPRGPQGGDAKPASVQAGPSSAQHKLS